MPATDLWTYPVNSGTFAFGSVLAVATSGSMPRFALAASADLPTLTVVAKDYSFEVPASVAGGLTTVTLDNQGMDFHHAMFLKLNDGTTVDQVKAAKDERAVFALGTSIGGPMIGPGEQATVVMNLEEGNYAVLCIIPGPDGMAHYQMGMIAPLAVTAAPAMAGTAPTPDLTIELIEMMFHGLPSTLTAGPTVWEVTNAGTVLHEMVVFKLAEGVTGEQVLGIILGPPPSATPEATPVVAAPSGPPPFALAGVAAPMSPGHTVYPELTLDAGNYFAACFIFDPSAGQPHALMGMQMSFTVA